jgi:uncharacterized membrane protein YbhN (UPF0104 family)
VNSTDKDLSSTRSNRPPILRWAGTLLAVALLVYLLSHQGWDEIGGAIRQIAWWRFALALILIAISRMAVAGRWHVLMRSANTGIRPRQSIEITFAGLFASNFLPTTIGGDVVRLAGAIRLGFDKAVSVASLVVDRLVGMAGMAMALPFAIPTFLRTMKGTSALSLSFALPWVKPLWERLMGAFRKLFTALTLWLRQPRSLLEALGFTWVHMLCTFGQVWLLLGGMGEHISFWLVAGLWSATYFVTLLPISINGMGVQELSMAFFFTTFGGVSQASGLTLALLMRALQMLASLPGAFFIPGLVAGEGKPDSSPRK